MARDLPYIVLRLDGEEVHGPHVIVTHVSFAMLDMRRAGGRVMGLLISRVCTHVRVRFPRAPSYSDSGFRPGD